MARPLARRHDAFACREIVPVPDGPGAAGPAPAPLQPQRVATL